MASKPTTSPIKSAMKVPHNLAVNLNAISITHRAKSANQQHRQAQPSNNICPSTGLVTLKQAFYTLLMPIKSHP
nr:hypothetical protein [Marinomonas primoryensis]